MNICKCLYWIILLFFSFIIFHLQEKFKSTNTTTLHFVMALTPCVSQSQISGGKCASSKGIFWFSWRFISPVEACKQLGPIYFVMITLRHVLIHPWRVHLPPAWADCGYPNWRWTIWIYDIDNGKAKQAIKLGSFICTYFICYYVEMDLPSGFLICKIVITKFGNIFSSVAFYFAGCDSIPYRVDILVI